jgi:hypothetical protein
MIAAGSVQTRPHAFAQVHKLVAFTNPQDAKAIPILPRFLHDIMSNFLFNLVSNLTFLATVAIACQLCNRFAPPDAALNGGYVFIALASAALMLDAALTFLVFADAQSRYGQFSSPAAFLERTGAYAIACIVALGCARALGRGRGFKANARNMLVIRTSAYTESHLPM